MKAISLNRINLFLPLLFIYLSMVYIFASDEFVGDEKRYVRYATNLSKGYYTTQEDLELVNGPGYPIFLLPFVVLKIDLSLARWANSVFLFIAIVYFHATLQLYIDKGPAIKAAYLLGLYPHIIKFIPRLMPECLVFFLLCFFMYHFTKLIKNTTFKWSDSLPVSFIFGYLILTRVIFAYVTVSIALLLLFTFFISKNRKSIIAFFMVTSAFVWCIPYLIYTHNLTGKYFLWATNSGEELYWMSTPYPEEYGEWFPLFKVSSNQKLRANHGEFLKKIESLNSYEKDVIYRQAAFKNIRSNPLKYLQNWCSNTSRLLFNYPYSYQTQTIRTYAYIIPNMIIIFLLIFCCFPAWKFRSMLPFEIIIIFVMALIYIGGSTLVAATSRYFTFILPAFFLWISYILGRFVQIIKSPTQIST